MLCLRKQISDCLLNINDDGVIWMFDTNFKDHCVYTAKADPEVVKILVQHVELLSLDTSGEWPAISFGGLKISLNCFEVNVAVPIELEPTPDIKKQLDEMNQKLDKLLVSAAPKHNVIVSAERTYTKDNILNYTVYQWGTPVTFNRITVDGHGVDYSANLNGLKQSRLNPSFEIPLQTGYKNTRIWHLSEPITCSWLKCCGTVYSAWLE